jgi:hypothetical protein
MHRSLPFFDTFTAGEAPTVSNFIYMKKGNVSKVQRELQHEGGGGGWNYKLEGRKEIKQKKGAASQLGVEQGLI